MFVIGILRILVKKCYKHISFWNDNFKSLKEYIIISMNKRAISKRSIYTCHPACAAVFPTHTIILCIFMHVLSSNTFSSDNIVPLFHYEYMHHTAKNMMVFNELLLLEVRGFHFYNWQLSL